VGKPVQCGDGTCHSDYISCLKSLARVSAAEGTPEERRERRARARVEAKREVQRRGERAYDDKGVVLPPQKTSKRRVDQGEVDL
jgi:hypothetical protein